MCVINKVCLSLVSLVIFQNENKFEQVIRSYTIPGKKDKRVVYVEIFKKLEEGSQNRIRTGTILLSPVYRIAISTAATLILVFLLHFLLSTRSFESDTQQAMAIRLPDHSRVILSPNSTASYPKYLWNREIKLKGEAYFEVEKGEKFIVKTKQGNVQVLGTRFQVSETEDGMIINCYEGKVKLTDNQQEKLVTAGNSLDYRQNGLIQLSPIQDMFPEAAKFKQSFSNERLETVLTLLEDFFQINIDLQITQAMHFSGKLETADAETAIKIICRSMNLNYTFNANEVQIINENEKSYEN